MGHIACIGMRRGAFRVLVGKSEGKRPHESPRHSWEINIKGISRKWDGGVYWIDVAQESDRWWALVNALMNLWFP